MRNAMPIIFLSALPCTCVSLHKAQCQTLQRHQASRCQQLLQHPNVPTTFPQLSDNHLDHWVGQISRKSRLKEISTEPSGAKIFSRTSTSCSQVSPYAGSQTQSEQITSRHRSVTASFQITALHGDICDLWHLWQSLSLWYLEYHLTLPVNAVWTPVKTLKTLKEHRVSLSFRYDMLRPHSKLANGQPFPSIFVVTAMTHTKRAVHPFQTWREPSTNSWPILINMSPQASPCGLATCENK
jgi:hypothetical protein